MALLNYVQDELKQENLEWTDEGFLKCKNVSYAGVCDMKYHISELKAWEDIIDPKDADEKGMIVVKRVADDLFSEQCINSIKGKDVTWRHPKGSVNPDNYNELSKGVAVDAVRDGDELKGEILIKDKKLAKAVYDGKYRGVSLGYKSELVKDDMGYHWYNSVNNHIAIVARPRNQRGFIADENFEENGGDTVQVDELTPILKKVQDAIYKSDYETKIVRHTEHDTETGEDIEYEIQITKCHSKREEGQIGDQQTPSQENLTQKTKENNINDEKENENHMNLEEFKKLDLFGMIKHYKQVADELPDSEAKDEILSQLDTIAKEVHGKSLAPKKFVGDEKSALDGLNPVETKKTDVQDEQKKNHNIFTVTDEELELVTDEYYEGLDPMNRAFNDSFEKGLEANRVRGEMNFKGVLRKVRLQGGKF
jgi:hypothetical protein